MSVGRILKEIRKEKGMTQVEFAKHLDMSRSFIGDIENDRYVPNPNTIQKIADKLNISTYYLTTGEKTSDDMTEDELKELWWQKEGFFDKQMDDLKKQIDKDFSEVLGMRLSFSEEVFLLQAAAFLRDYDNEAIVLMSGILRQYNYNKDVNQLTDDKDKLFKDIETMKTRLEEVFLKRYGLEDNEKSD